VKQLLEARWRAAGYVFGRGVLEFQRTDPVASGRLKVGQLVQLGLRVAGQSEVDDPPPPRVGGSVTQAAVHGQRAAPAVARERVRCLSGRRDGAGNLTGRRWVERAGPKRQLWGEERDRVSTLPVAAGTRVGQHLLALEPATAPGEHTRHDWLLGS